MPLWHRVVVEMPFQIKTDRTVTGFLFTGEQAFAAAKSPASLENANAMNSLRRIQESLESAGKDEFAPKMSSFLAQTFAVEWSVVTLSAKGLHDLSLKKRK